MTYLPPDVDEIVGSNIEVHHLGYYINGRLRRLTIIQLRTQISKRVLFEAKGLIVNIIV